MNNAIYRVIDIKSDFEINDLIKFKVKDIVTFKCEVIDYNRCDRVLDIKRYDHFVHFDLDLSKDYLDNLFELYYHNATYTKYGKVVYYDNENEVVCNRGKCSVR